MKKVMALSVCMLLFPVFTACGRAPDSFATTSLQNQQPDSIEELAAIAMEAWSAGRQLSVS